MKSLSQNLRLDEQRAPFLLEGASNHRAYASYPLVVMLTVPGLEPRGKQKLETRSPVDERAKVSEARGQDKTKDGTPRDRL